MHKAVTLTFSYGRRSTVCERTRLTCYRHSGRANIPQMTGTPIVSPSGLPWDNPDECFAYPPPHTSKQARYIDNPPIALTVEHIKRTIQDYVRTAKWALESGFDGVELHGGNGYLPEQFLASNVNKRTDAYGGSPEKRCTFTLELMDQLSKAIGEENLAIRLSPFGLFNQIRCEQRMETWTTLCRKLKEAHPNLSYVSFVEPVSTDNPKGAIYH
jgi:2,4-dienoyl-CoA reductase-like NADH-dependent reductase (Old Yellow Enzyme family)